MNLIDNRELLNILKKKTVTIGVGIGTTPPKETDTDLEFPIGHRIPISSYDKRDDQIRIMGFFPHTISSNFAITEAGIFDEQGKLLVRDIHEPKAWGWDASMTVIFEFDIEIVAEE